MDTKRYASLVVLKKAAEMVKREARKSRRPIAVEAEILIGEAVEARKKSEKVLTHPDVLA